MEAARTFPQQRRARTRYNDVDVDTVAPFKAWPEMLAYLSGADPDSPTNPPHPRFAQGDHVAIIGPTGTGKTHIALAIAELRTHVLVVACKPRDPLIEDATRRGYWLVPDNKLEIPYVDGRPLHPRVIYWPRMSGRTAGKLPPQALLRAEKAMQKPAVGGAIGYVRREGHWALVLDEGTWICRDLNLQRDVDSALFQFRTLNASVIVLGQRPSWMGRYVLSQPTHLFLFQTSDTNDRKALGDISAVDTKVVQEVVRTLSHRKHESLYINTRTREMYRTVAPPR